MRKGRSYLVAYKADRSGEPVSGGFMARVSGGGDLSGDSHYALTIEAKLTEACESDPEIDPTTVEYLMMEVPSRQFNQFARKQAFDEFVASTMGLYVTMQNHSNNLMREIHGN